MRSGTCARTSPAAIAKWGAMRGLALSLVLSLVLFLPFSSPAMSAEKGCPGTFLRDSQGYLASEGGAEPSGDFRKKGEQGLFLYYDIMDGERYVRFRDGDEHKARAVALKPGCTLTKLRAGGKY